jgi:hypothetical protein
MNQIGCAVGAAAQSVGHAYERFVGWLAIFVLWIAQAKGPEPLRAMMLGKQLLVIAAWASFAVIVSAVWVLFLFSLTY